MNKSENGLDEQFQTILSIVEKKEIYTAIIRRSLVFREKLGENNSLYQATLMNKKGQNESVVVKVFSNSDKLDRETLIQFLEESSLIIKAKSPLELNSDSSYVVKFKDMIVKPVFGIVMEVARYKSSENIFNEPYKLEEDEKEHIAKDILGLSDQQTNQRLDQQINQQQEKPSDACSNNTDAVLAKIKSEITTMPSIRFPSTCMGKSLVSCKELDKGAFSTVYNGILKNTAAQEQEEEPVAIKQFCDIYYKKLGLFLDESALMLKLNSPYIVTFKDLTISPICSIVMELMPLGSLRQVLDSACKLALEQKQRIAKDILHGLSYLHKMGIIHRDLKSENVLIGNGLRAKLADLGLSKYKSNISKNKSSSAAGTLRYMAPEVSEGNPHNEKTDMYSYGMVAWELATKQTAFLNKSRPEVLSIKQYNQHEKIPESMPPCFSKLIKWCWDRPDKRPTAEEATNFLESQNNTRGCK